MIYKAIQLIHIFCAHGRTNEGNPRGPRGSKKYQSKGCNKIDNYLSPSIVLAKIIYSMNGMQCIQYMIQSFLSLLCDYNSFGFTWHQTILMQITKVTFTCDPAQCVLPGVPRRAHWWVQTGPACDGGGQKERGGS